MAWWLRHRTSMPEVVGLIPAQVRPHSNTLRKGIWTRLLPDRTESRYIGVQNVQHLEIHWRFNGVLSPGGNVRLVKSCEWLPTPTHAHAPESGFFKFHWILQLLIEFLWWLLNSHIVRSYHKQLLMSTGRNNRGILNRNGELFRIFSSEVNTYF